MTADDLTMFAWIGLFGWAWPRLGFCIMFIVAMLSHAHS
jgi:hypothetical protein